MLQDFPVWLGLRDPSTSWVILPQISQIRAQHMGPGTEKSFPKNHPPFFLLLFLMPDMNWSFNPHLCMGVLKSFTISVMTGVVLWVILGVRQWGSTQRLGISLCMHTQAGRVQFWWNKLIHPNPRRFFWPPNLPAGAQDFCNLPQILLIPILGRDFLDFCQTFHLPDTVPEPLCPFSLL